MNGMMYVYELPEKLSNGYCFAGGVPIVFQNVDWMDDPVDLAERVGQPAPSEEQMRRYLMGKKYIRPGRRYLVLSESMTFTLWSSVD